jgi:multidrug resistance efflux pump
MRVRTVLILLAVAALGAVVVHTVQSAAAGGSGAVDEARAKILTYRGDWVKVQRGDFEIAIEEDGELRPVKVTSLNFLVPGKVGFIAPEGSYVTKDERVIALETKDLEDDITHTREDLATAEITLTQQEQLRDLEIKRLATELQAEKDRADFAALKLRETLAHPAKVEEVERAQAKNMIEAAEARMKSALADVAVLKPLYEQGYCTRQDYDLKVSALEKARIENTRAAMKARILKYGALDDDRALAALDCENEALTLKIKELDNQDQLHQLDMRVKAYDRVVKQSQTRLQRRLLELERCTLRAPHDGVVVYRTMYYRGNKKPEIGERVSPYIAPIDLPNYDKMKVRTQVPESLIRTMRPRTASPVEGGEPVRGSPARVTVNTLPGISYTAQVTWIDGWARDRNSRLSEADVRAQGLSGVKVFDVEVELDGSDPKHLREGFRARVDFPEETLKNVIAVPEQAVSTIDGISTVMVLQGSAVARQVELGRSSRGKVVIVSGLKENEQVWVPRIVTATSEEKGADAKKGPQKGSKPSDKKGPPRNPDGAPEPGGKKGGEHNPADRPRVNPGERPPERSERDAKAVPPKQKEPA